MATTVSCDMCKQTCQRAKEVNGVFDARLFDPDAPEGFVRIRMLVQVYVTTEVFPTKAKADLSRLLKSKDQCAGCMHKAMALMLGSLVRVDEGG